MPGAPGELLQAHAAGLSVLVTAYAALAEEPPSAGTGW